MDFRERSKVEIKSVQGIGYFRQVRRSDFCKNSCLGCGLCAFSNIQHAQQGFSTLIQERERGKKVKSMIWPLKIILKLLLGFQIDVLKVAVTVPTQCQLQLYCSIYFPESQFYPQGFSPLCIGPLNIQMHTAEMQLLFHLTKW